MNEIFVLDILREAFIVILEMSAIPLLVSLVLGVVVSLIQALTQIQESTLSFAPKIVAVFFSLVLSFPYMANVMVSLCQRLFLSFDRYIT